MMATSQAATNPHADNVMSGEMMNSGSMSPKFAVEKDNLDMTFISTPADDMKLLALRADALDPSNTKSVENLDSPSAVPSGTHKNNKHHKQKVHHATGANDHHTTGAQLHAAMASASLTPDQKNKLKKGRFKRPRQ
jgi:hypothetical protein